MPWLAERLRNPKPLILPGAYDALSARMVERSGAEAIYCGGFAACASAYGLPDRGLVTATEMADHVRRIRAVTTLPMIVDADTGYGDLGNVERTIRGLAAQGISACHVEDQVFPKRCGHMRGKRTVGRTEATERMQAAIAASRACGLDIIARTDAIATEGLDEAIARANLFLALGAAAVFIDAPRHAEDLRVIAARVAGPKVLNVAFAEMAPADLPAGYQIVLRPVDLLLAGFRAVSATLGLPAGPDGSQKDWPGHLQHILDPSSEAAETKEKGR